VFLTFVILHDETLGRALNPYWYIRDERFYLLKFTDQQICGTHACGAIWRTPRDCQVIGGNNSNDVAAYQVNYVIKLSK